MEERRARWQGGNRIVLVIPAYNEADVIAETLRTWLAVLVRLGLDASIVVVDDGSTDATPDLVRALGEQSPNVQLLSIQNGGHGAALLAGYTIAAARVSSDGWVGQADADSEVPPEAFSDLWALRHEAPIVAGFRAPHRAPWRRCMSRGAALLVLVLFGERIPDPNVPFRVMRADWLAQVLPLLPARPAAPNILLSVLACRTAIVTVPVAFHERDHGRTLARRLLVEAGRCTCQLVALRLGWTSRNRLARSAAAAGSPRQSGEWRRGRPTRRES